jgi:chorismate dehydratase
MRIGSVPYLNAKPLVDWFHSGEADSGVDLRYAVPSQLAAMLRADEIDVANCSVFEAFQRPGLVLLPDMSISADGAVKSVRLFSKTPLEAVRSVALDTSSLTSSALVRILLKESFGATPTYHHHAPDLDGMLEKYDAGLIIGDLKLFDLQPGTAVYDLGQGWQDLTGLPFVYAAWLAREDRVSEEMVHLLTAAKCWGVAHLDALAETWAARMGLPLERSRDYLVNVMNYDLAPRQMGALRLFQHKCVQHDLISALHPLQLLT